MLDHRHERVSKVIGTFSKVVLFVSQVDIGGVEKARLHESSLTIPYDN